MWKTSLDRKTVMAVSGLFLIGFLIAHLLGNLQIFLGQEWLNSYAQHLEDLPLLVIPVNAILLAAFLAHVSTAVLLSAQNRAARPITYAYKKTVQATLASRTLPITGLVIFLFVVYHLLHYTWGVAHPQYFHLTDAKGRHDVYSMVVLGFQNAPISAVYVTALLVLSVHVGHGASSFLQTLGLTPRGAQKKFRLAGQLFGWLLFFAYAAIPVSVLAGWLAPLQGGPS